MRPANKSLREKSAARMAAAQMLYANALNGSKPDPARMLQEHDGYLSENKTQPNMALLKKLLEGVVTHGNTLEPWIDKALTGDWKKDRMSPLLLAILRLAVFELAEMRQTASPIIVNEYVTLTGQFFGDAETGFMNAVLNALAVELRA